MNKDILNLNKAYHSMLLLRIFEDRCAEAYRNGYISGFCHLYSGQEICGTSVQYAITKKDHTITSYRCHAHAILSGEDPKFVMAELFGKSTGSSGGKGGSMHIFNPEGNFWGGHGIVGAQVPIGTGIAFAEKYKNTGGITAVFFGDGAANQGQVYESFNMASLWKLPVLYIIENNAYSMGTCCARHSASGIDFSKRGEPFGIKGIIIDDRKEDFIDIYNKVKKIVDEIRKTNIPQLIQFNTYRYRGHSMSDPATYRTKDEVKNFRDNDPIEKLKNYILKNKTSTEKELLNIEAKINNIVDEAYNFALESV